MKNEDAKNKKVKKDPRYKIESLGSFEMENKQIGEINNKNKEDLKLGLSGTNPLKRSKRKILETLDDVEIIERMEPKIDDMEIKLRKSLLESNKNKEKKKEFKEVKAEVEVSENNENEEGEDEEEIKSNHEPEKNLEEIRSINIQTNAENLTHTHYSLRSAIDERYIPSSIRNITYATNIIYFFIIGMAIASFVYQAVIYNGIKKNIVNINGCQDRVMGIINIAVILNNLLALNMDYVQHTSGIAQTPEESFIKEEGEVLDYFIEASRKQIVMQAVSLKDSEVQITMKSTDFQKETSAKINPVGMVLIKYSENQEEEPFEYTYTMWQSVMEVVVGCFRVSGTNLEEINMSCSAWDCSILAKLTRA